LIDVVAAIGAVVSAPKIAACARVRIRNSDAQRHLKSQLDLVIQKKLARIQAAGANGFVKGSAKRTSIQRQARRNLR
jgi:hypothetical protein